MIITLCGSARFEDDFHRWNELLTMDGHAVFSLAVFPSVKGGKDWYTPGQKATLDRVHKLKIDASDAVFVIDTGGYVGESTAGEIAHAKAAGKAVYYASRSCDDPVVLWNEEDGRRYRDQDDMPDSVGV